jgi:hypothetical protein
MCQCCGFRLEPLPFQLKVEIVLAFKLNMIIVMTGLQMEASIFRVYLGLVGVI